MNDTLNKSPQPFFYSTIKRLSFPSEQSFRLSNAFFVLLSSLYSISLLLSFKKGDSSPFTDLDFILRIVIPSVFPRQEMSVILRKNGAEMSEGRMG